jgi:uncharacterized protein (TIGR02145 family)
MRNNLVGREFIRCMLSAFIIINSLTLCAQTTDSFRDPRGGQVYQTVRIGDQWWMAQNLNFRIGKSFYYLHDSSYASPYGRLYYYEDAVKACPAGWHLPTDEEWTVLTDYLGGSGVAANKMKKTDGRNWDYFSKDDKNESGFSALPGGCQSSDWEFGMMRFLGFWWTATAVDELSAWNRHMECGKGEVSRNAVKKTDGLSVRCLKN